MVVLVDVLDSRYSSGLRVQTWNVESITKEIYEYVSKHRNKIHRIWFGDNIYSSSEYADPENDSIQRFLDRYHYVIENEHDL